MNDETEYTVCCPRCNRQLLRAVSIESILECECGYRFYMFQKRGLVIMLPSDEARYEPIARTMRRFVVATGRCNDIPPELYIDDALRHKNEMIVGSDDIKDKLDAYLKEYGEIAFGSQMLGIQEIELIFQVLDDGKEVIVKKKRDSYSVLKLDGVTNLSNDAHKRKESPHNSAKT